MEEHAGLLPRADVVVVRDDRRKAAGLLVALVPTHRQLATFEIDRRQVTVAPLYADASEQDAALFLEDLTHWVLGPREESVLHRHALADGVFESQERKIGDEVRIAVEHGRSEERRVGKANSNAGTQLL